MKKRVIIFAFLPLLALFSCVNGGGNATNLGGQSVDSESSPNESIPEVKYTIDFDLDGGNSPSYHGPITVRSLSTSDFFFDCRKTGWNFRGWSYNGRQVFNESGELLFQPAMSDNMTFKAIYSQTAKLTIEINMPEAGTVTGMGEYPYNTSVDVVATPNKGYVFVGWSYQGGLLSDEAAYRCMMWNDDITLLATFKYATYKLSLNVSDPDLGSLLVKPDTQYRDSCEKMVDYKAEVTVVAYSKTEARFLGWFDQRGSLVDPGAVYAFSMPFNDLSLTAKWEAPTFHLTVTSSDASLGTASIVSGTGVKGEVITVRATPLGGAFFLGWYSGDTLVSADNPYTFIMPGSDVTFVAKFQELSELRRALYAEPTLSPDGRTLTYGAYPQSVVSDAATTASLGALSSPDATGYYWLGGSYYGKLNSFWFRVEPIRWNVLSNDNGECLVTSSLLLDAHRYNEKYSGQRDGVYANEYAHSEIRAWLNSDFLSAAFPLGSDAILTTTVDNSAASTAQMPNERACEDTQDRVFLLSYQDLTNVSYGFTDDASRRCVMTDYAARGPYFSGEYGAYWTRSPISGNSNYALIVYADGRLGDIDVDYSSVLIRPSLTVKVS